jgi:phosphoribosyl 1,2-cyclic phosphodiesterase
MLTHAHLDHSGGLARGAPCPVYATRRTWRSIKRYPIRERRAVALRQPVQIEGMHFEAFAAEHSLLAPAVGYRITAGKVAIFYCPDLVSIHQPSRALSGIAAYVGDGAMLTRPLVRKRAGHLVGHAPIESQLAWCHTFHVPRAIITHCGTQIVTSESKLLEDSIEELSCKYQLRLDIAEDGMPVVLRTPAVRR